MRLGFFYCLFVISGLLCTNCSTISRIHAKKSSLSLLERITEALQATGGFRSNGSEWRRGQQIVCRILRGSRAFSRSGVAGRKHRDLSGKQGCKPNHLLHHPVQVRARRERIVQNRKFNVQKWKESR
uniref:Putative secreted protein n=1 Tax=Anopheles darlingi TaxID=43151 RepID=A0A2M4D6A1_ANODA